MKTLSHRQSRLAKTLNAFHEGEAGGADDVVVKLLLIFIAAVIIIVILLYTREDLFKRVKDKITELLGT